MKPPLMIGIAGGSGSGKSFFLQKLMEAFREDQVSLLSLDNYYKPIDLQPRDDKGIENFDLPESIDREKFYNDLQKLRKGEDLQLVEYTFNNTRIRPSTLRIRSTPVIMVEGIYTFYYEEVNDLLDLKVFIDAPDYLMLTRRITRDAEERGYDLNDVLYRFQHHVTPSFKKYIEPLKSEADLIIPNYKHFTTALNVLTAYLRDHLTK